MKCKQVQGLAVGLLAVSWATIASASPFAYVTNNVSNSVSVIDTANDTVIATIPVGAGPLGVAANAQGTRAYTANYSGNSVSVIDTVANSVIATVVLPSSTNPASLVVNERGDRVYVENGNGTISVINTGSNTVSATLGIPAGGLAVNLTGTRLYVGPTSSDLRLRVIDTATNTIVASVSAAYASSINPMAVNPQQNRLYTTDSQSLCVSIWDISVTPPVKKQCVGSSIFPADLAVNPLASRVYASDGRVINTGGPTCGNASIITIIPGISGGGNQPWSVAVSPLGNKAYVVDRVMGMVRVVDTSANLWISSIAVGNTPDSIAIGPFAPL